MLLKHCAFGENFPFQWIQTETDALAYLDFRRKIDRNILPLMCCESLFRLEFAEWIVTSVGRSTLLVSETATWEQGVKFKPLSLLIQGSIHGQDYDFICRHIRNEVRYRMNFVKP